MSKKDLNINIDELESALGTVKGLKIQLGRITDEEWEEPMVPIPFPTVSNLRNSAPILLDRKVRRRG